MQDTPAFDPLIQTEKIAFDPNQMIECRGCARRNAPDRLKCVYCGTELAILDTTTIRLTLRKVEPWERAFSVIVLDASTTTNVTAAADLLSIDVETVSAIVRATSPLPIARIETQAEAVVVRDRLEQMGFRCSIVSDDELAIAKPPVRLGGIDWLNDKLAFRNFNTGEVSIFDRDAIVLLVTGSVGTARVDALEKKRRGGKAKLLDESTTSSDETLLDIYTRDDERGFRIHEAGFDFSCLGEDKGLLAGQNLRHLVERLSDLLPNAKLVNEYATIRKALGAVWEVESRKDPRGLQRVGFGTTAFGSAITSSNLDQFTKYSRLQRHLL